MAASVAFGYTLMLRRTSMRRVLSFVMASAILLAGVALTGFEIVRSDGVRPFVLFGALVMVVIINMRFVSRSAVQPDRNPVSGAFGPMAMTCTSVFGGWSPLKS
jgi:hypothetical protein